MVGTGSDMGGTVRYVRAGRNHGLWKGEVLWHVLRGMRGSETLSFVALLSALMMLCAEGARYAMPADGPVPFRRDRLPMEVAMISNLADMLCEISELADGKRAQDRRVRVQMLAVAVALDPESDRARRILKRFADESGGKKDAVADLAGRCGRVWQTIEWLESAEAGHDGQALAACLLDVMAVVDPSHPRSDEARRAGQGGAWKGWVPDLAEYEEARSSKNDDPKPEKIPEQRKEPPKQVPSEPPRIRLAEAAAPALIWKNTAQKWPPQWQLVTQSLTMKARIRPRQQWEIEQEIHRPMISSGSNSESEPFGELQLLVERVLRNRHGKLPADLSIEIRHPGLDDAGRSQRRNVLSGVCAALAHAAISGVELEGLIVGTMEKNGRFATSNDFWAQLRALGDSSGYRIIVPADAEELVMAYLGLEKPEFFINNQVLLAKNLDEVMSLAAKKPDEDLGRILGRFQEIQEKRGAQDVRIYIGNTFVRQRLEAISMEEPRHLSSKALVIQALGRRPITVPRRVLASELLQIAHALRWARRSEYVGQDKVKQLAADYKEMRERIDKIAKYAAKDDLDLIDRITRMASALRDFEKARRSGGGGKNALDRAYDAFVKMAEDAVKK